MKDHNLRFKLSYSSIIAMIIPISFSILIPQINILVNNFFLSKLSLEALAVGGITGVYYLIFSVVSHGFNSGIQNLMSVAAGENNRRQIGIYLNQSIILALIISTFSIAITYFITPYIFDKLLSAEIEPICTSFVKIRILGLPILFLYQLRNTIFIVLQKTRWLFIATLAETLVNILMDYCLIFGNFGCPNLGIEGAAWASIIAELSGLVLVSILIVKLKLNTLIALKLKLKVKKHHLMKILNRSLPLMVQFFLSVFCFEIFYLMISHMGIEALAVSNIMRLIFGFVGCFAWAAANASNSIVSNLLGQNKVYQLKLFLKKMAFITFIACFILIFILLCFRTFILEVFDNKQEFIDYATPVYYVVCLALFAMAYGCIAINILIGLGKSKVILVLECLSLIVYICYSIYLVNYLKTGLAIAWTNEILYWLSMLVPSIFLIRNTLRKMRLK
ncbi:MAG: MATE family efflux transporter [Alphaproteobacteria bacterium]|nr:MATE family efflux transporter [Alphaproteobacteria bacterium]